MPDPVPSSPVRVSVGEAYQPSRIAGVSVAVVTGVFRSTLTVAVTDVVPPSLVAAQVRLVIPSAVTVVSSQPVVESAFATVQSTVTGTVHQPFAPSGVAGESVYVTAGFSIETAHEAVEVFDASLTEVAVSCTVVEAELPARRRAHRAHRDRLERRPARVRGRLGA